jgi:hypothetical protein
MTWLLCVELRLRDVAVGCYVLFLQFTENWWEIVGGRTAKIVELGIWDLHAKVALKV